MSSNCVIVTGLPSATPASYNFLSISLSTITDDSIAEEFDELTLSSNFLVNSFIKKWWSSRITSSAPQRLYQIL